MKNNLNQTKAIVRNVLKESTSSRNNDLVLMAKVLEKMGYSTDIKELAEVSNTNILETIARTRRKIQAEEPFLAPTGTTASHRKIREKEIIKWNRL